MIIVFELFLLAVLLLVMWHLYRLRRRIREDRNEFDRQMTRLQSQNDHLQDTGLKLWELKEALEKEQEKSARLLRNILPEKVIRDLQEKGESTPERYENVAVFFADIVNFTGIAPELDPQKLILELSEIFSEFDRIFASCGCERIKTIGDAYMAVAGLQNQENNVCENMLRAAIAVRDYLDQRNRQTFGQKWVMRFGINAGTVVGGIVGRDKYLYDIFGDTVNIASRLEHASEAMKINVSRQVYDQTSGKFDFTARGLIEVKGRGKIEMFFLDGEKTV